MKRLKHFVIYNYAGVAVIMFVILMVLNIILLPSIIAPKNIVSTLALAAPFVLSSMAAACSILSGGGGIDISLALVMTLVNVGVFTYAPAIGCDSPVKMVILMLVIGAAIGCFNGVIVTLVRLQPIVATLVTNLILTGLCLVIMPTPMGSAEAWLVSWGKYLGPVPAPLIVVGIVCLLWFILTRTNFHKMLMAVGGDERAAFSAGLPVTAIRILAYTLGGLIAAVAGLALTAVIASGNPSSGSSYMMMSIAGCAIGGTSLAGGRGGMVGAVIGALDVYLIQKLLSVLGASNYWFQVAYGLLLIGSLLLNFFITKKANQKGAEVEGA